MENFIFCALWQVEFAFLLYCKFFLVSIHILVNCRLKLNIFLLEWGFRKSLQNSSGEIVVWEKLSVGCFDSLSLFKNYITQSLWTLTYCKPLICKRTCAYQGVTECWLKSFKLRNFWTNPLIILLTTRYSSSFIIYYIIIYLLGNVLINWIFYVVVGQRLDIFGIFAWGLHLRFLIVVLFTLYCFNRKKYGIWRLDDRGIFNNIVWQLL